MEKNNLVNIFLDEEGDISYEIGDLSEQSIELIIGLMETIKHRIILNNELNSQTEESNSQ